MATYSERLAANAEIGVAAVAALVLFASCSHDRDRIEPDGGTKDPCPQCDASDAVEERLDSREADAESTDSRPLEFTNQDVDVADSKPVQFNNQDADAALDAL